MKTPWSFPMWQIEGEWQPTPSCFQRGSGGPAMTILWFFKAGRGKVRESSDNLWARPKKRGQGRASSDYLTVVSKKEGEWCQSPGPSQGEGRGKGK